MAQQPGPLTDTHCHLGSPHFAGRVGEVLARAEAVGVQTVIVPGWDRDSSVQALALAAAYPALRPAVGLHPWFVARDADLAWLPALLDDPRVAAVGEIGVDGAIDDADVAQQLAIFRVQVRYAVARDLPILIHCRRGWDRLLPCLREFPGVRGVVHAFSGSREVMHDCLRLGLYLAFAGMVTRPNSRRAREAAALVPADRLLLETDAPYMALDGVPAEQAEPAHLPRVLTCVAALRGVSPEALAEQVGRNVQELFGG
ncbi:MAG TPA: TatD family hydrolase [Armatimonadota bacterium]